MSSRAGESEFPISLRGAFFEDPHDRKSYDVLAAELQAALAREATCLRREKRAVAAASHAGRGVRASARQQPAVDRQSAVIAKPDGHHPGSGRAIDRLQPVGCRR